MHISNLEIHISSLKMKIITGIEKFLKVKEKFLGGHENPSMRALNPKRGMKGNKKKQGTNGRGSRTPEIMLKRKENIKSIGFMQNTAIPA